MKLNLDDLAGVKLVTDDNNYLSVDELRMLLENAYMQGSQGWGVRRETAALLTMARDLKIAMEIAFTADEAQRMLKGAQMEGGRLKKKIAKLEAKVVALDSLILAQDLQLKDLQAQLDSDRQAAFDRETALQEQLDELDTAE